MGEQRRLSPRERRLPNEPHGEERSLEGLRAGQLGDEPGREAPGLVGRPTDGVLVQVCLECGKELTFDKTEPPTDMACPKCGNQVFRSFFAARGHDDVDEDFRRSTERDLATNDDESDVTRADILDLNNL